MIRERDLIAGQRRARISAELVSKRIDPAIPVRIDALTLEKGRLLDSGAKLNAQINELRRQWDAQVGRPVSNIDQQIVGLKRTLRDARLLDLDEVDRLAEAERFAEISAIANEAKSTMIQRAAELAVSDSPVENAFGKVVGSFLANPEASERLPYIIEESLGDYRRLDNFHRPLIGERPGGRLIFLADGNVAVISHTPEVLNGLGLIVDGYVPLFGLVTENGGHDKARLRPFIIEKTPFYLPNDNIVYLGNESRGVAVATEAITKYLTTGKITVRKDQGRITLPNPHVK
jgi:hypothetical protein